ncbi:MAG: DUF5930 domain-containing protein, partial [Sphingopyxis sp.]|uniref:DUF5930 domain-containing protein n=1 Tax=Sphingopyxis sp. TaxID=1908224 RepID=UPI0040374AB1
MADLENGKRPGLIGRWFPTRYLYLRDGDEVRARALTPGKQRLGAAGAVVAGAWILASSGALTLDLIHLNNADSDVVRARAEAQRLNADLQARLDSAVVRMSATTGSLDEMAQMVERRHAALTRVMGMFQGVEGAEAALAPAPALDPADANPVQRIVAI